MLLAFFTSQMIAQEITPTVSFTGPDGETSTDESYTGSAPVHASFEAHPSNADGWTAYYEWRFYKDNAQEPYIIRYEENTEFDFTESGNIRVILYAKFTMVMTTSNAPTRKILSPSPLPRVFSRCRMRSRRTVMASTTYTSRRMAIRVSQNFMPTSSTDGDRSSSNGPTLLPDGTAPTRESRSRMASTSASSRLKVQMARYTI